MLELQDLADEIFLEIFSHLVCAELAVACLLSRRLGALAQYVLYRTPSVCGYQLDNPSLLLFVRTILSRPILARSIRHLKFDGIIFGRQYTLSSRDTTLFTTAARRLELPYSMERSNQHLQLLLHLLPNLYALDFVRDDPDALDRFIEDYAIHDRTRTLPVAFRSLRHVHFSNTGRVGFTPKMLMNLFRLPSIRSITVHIRFNFTAAAYTGCSSTVTQLTLRSGSLSIWSLAQILQIPRALTHLSLVDWELSDSVFNGADFSLVLRLVCSTLQHLQLSPCDYMNIGRATVDNWQPNTIRSLRDWPALTTLRCSLTPLLGQGPEVAVTRLVDVLPLGIRELEIEADEHWSCLAVVDQITDLMDQKDICGLENLVVVTVGRKLGGEAWPLSGRCSAAGVRLLVSSTWC